MDFHRVTANSIQLLKEAPVSFLATWYFKFLLKIAICSQNLWFFDQCTRNGVFPKYMKLKSNNRSLAAQQGSIAGIKKWLATEKKLQLKKRYIYNIYLKIVHTELLHRLHFVEFLVIDSDSREKVSNIIHKKFLVQRKKLSALVNANRIKLKPNNETKHFSNHKFFDRFVNLTNVNFTNTETKLLEKGFNHNIQNNNTVLSFETLGVDTELALKEVPNNTGHKYFATNILKNEFLKKSYPKQETKILKDIKIKTKDVVFTKADKGNTVIAITKNDYIQKTVDFLDPNKYSILRNDPTKCFQKIIKTLIHNCKSLFIEKDSYKLTLMNPQAPKLYSLVKLHKTGNPIRPVVSFFSAPSYKLSKKLIDIILNHTNFSASFSIKNSYELVNKIKNINLPQNSKFISFDVTNLFPSIPIVDTIKLVNKLLIKNNVNFIKKQEILDILTECLKQNYFEFNGQFYTSNVGLIMGNPLSPLLAEIFMDFIESEIKKHPLFKKFLYWHRYVDDIFTCFTGTDRQLNIFTDFINNIHNNIKFTIETETNNSINFLDLTIKKQNNQHIFSIFHKPTHPDTTIHNSSCHPVQHKHAAFYSMVHRLITLPLNEVNFNIELNIIKQIAINNGYTSCLIDKILNKKIYKKTLDMVFPSNRDKKNKFKSLTYIGNASDTISKFLKKETDFNIAFRTNNSIAKHIKNNKTKTDKSNKSGVYKLTCSNCPKNYVGQTGRNFGQRIKEHFSSFTRKKNDSNYANHLLEENHSFNHNYKILHIENKGLKLNLLESLEINKFKNSDNLLNDHTDLNNSPLLNNFVRPF